MWDSDKEEFVPILPEQVEDLKKQGKSTFTVGDEFELRGLKMRVRKITKKDLVLRPFN